MDPLSQAVVGATCAGVACRKKEWMRPALIAGVVGGMLPDIDILIKSSSDPLLTLQYHRHFTHAFFFAPIGGLVAAALCVPRYKKYVPFLWLYIFATLGYATHGILDSMTNYGTHLWWPFTNARESWNNISIIDPMFTLTLLGLVITAAITQARKYMLIAACFALSYFALGFYQYHNAKEALIALAKERGHQYERLLVKPSLGNNLAWRIQYEYQGRYYIDAVHVSPWQGIKYYKGGSLKAFTLDDAKRLVPEGSKNYYDIKRFAHFSDNWLMQQDDNPNIIADARFSSLPYGLRPLWGIRLKPHEPDTHVDRISFSRERTKHNFTLLWKMIKGEDLPQE